MIRGLEVGKLAGRPVTAFILSLISGIFIMLGGLAHIALGGIIRRVFEVMGFGGRFGNAVVFLGVLGLIWGALVIVGAVMMNSGIYGMVRTGAVLVLVFSIVSWVGSVGGFFVGFILGLVGGIMGLIWRPSNV